MANQFIVSDVGDTMTQRSRYGLAASVRPASRSRDARIDSLLVSDTVIRAEALKYSIAILGAPVWKLAMPGS
jgi:hypothetical protein